MNPKLVNPEYIEAIVRVRRHFSKHYGRYAKETDMFYILHSKMCLGVHGHEGLLDCDFAQAEVPWLGTWWPQYEPVELRLSAFNEIEAVCYHQNTTCTCDDCGASPVAQ